MKVINTFFILMFLNFPLTAIHAEEAHHPDKKPTSSDMQGKMKPGMKGGGMGMMGNMGEHMQTMMKQMHEIRNTKDPDKRDRLIEEHMKSMQEGMKMMGGGMMGMMHGKGNKGGMMSMSKMDKPMGPEAMQKRMKMMEKRMNMMQGMMDQMIKSNQESVKTTKIRKRMHKK